ncbi:MULTISPECIES: ABC transporter ATP-binding protein [Mesorhizobium]|uniref:Spermidine/putrescine import ATP-binding protein PotA n=1 Tax=Rhizobium loti TaxID=381 RepID=A0A8E2WH08_RHILI|nr:MULTISPECIES: ABC transporter ATP-binding protein [Mesorhizobium]PWJ93812.1 putative spermidine/putrescine transport system ATP-binding protein [Mesorhizobium loti]QKC82181.1 ABC transporter ATP-binding protein [Mesorhizobium sp. NZP2077]QKD15654.1 ABC transporter ATP-binding protein [Mesorhizobium sp. NZP2077]
MKSAVPARQAGSLELRSLRKSYGGVVAVDDVSLSVRAGEFLTLLGPSGSGKSTTLMMIAGFVQPEAGSILLDNTDLVGIPTHKRSIGVVFQNYALFPHMSVAQNIGFPLRMRDMEEADTRDHIARATALVRLHGLEERYARQLSGGQQQRVALARALVFQPPLLLLDEPLGALDRMLREQMKHELRRVHQELGTTLIYVTHDQDEALVLSDRIAIMKNGRVEQIAPPREIYERPVNQFVAGFMGESNFLGGRVVGEHGGTATVKIGELLLQGVPSSGIRADQDVEVFIRPEKIVFTAPGDEKGWAGTVKDLIYSGDSIRYVISLGSAQVIVKQTVRQGVYLPARGDAVSLSWDPLDIILFPS